MKDATAYLSDLPTPLPTCSSFHLKHTLLLGLYKEPFFVRLESSLCYGLESYSRLKEERRRRCRNGQRPSRGQRSYSIRICRSEILESEASPLRVLQLSSGRRPRVYSQWKERS